MPSISNAETLLALDVGSVNTRANLFDVVDGSFRMLASSRVPSTARYPLLDFSEGIRVAIEHIQKVTGRTLLDESEMLITPSSGFGSGVDLCVATLSAGPLLRGVLVGLMPGVSVSSLKRLASSMIMEVAAVIHLNDRRRDHERIQLIVDLKPDVILVAGGTDGGASGPLLELIDLIGMAVERRPQEERPVLVFCGNRHLGATIVERLVERAQVIIAPNVRPGVEKEDLTSTRIRLMDVIAASRYRQVNGYDELKQWTSAHILPSPDAFGRVIRYLSASSDSEKGVLGVDLGAGQVTMAAGHSSEFSQHVRGDLGMGEPLHHLLEYTEMDRILRWLPVHVDAQEMHNYMLNKSAYPATVPVDRNELYMDLALAREILHEMLMKASRDWPDGVQVLRHGVLSPMETILVSGASLTRVPDPGLAVLTLLDGLQPTGVTALVMDPYSLAASLGVMSEVLPVGTVQVLESSSFPVLATVVAPMPGSTNSALHLRLDSVGGGHILETTVKAGELRFIPFSSGMEGSLVLRPDRGLDLGFGGAGKAGIVPVRGGIAGIVIDLRGRPLTMPGNMSACEAINQKWLNLAGVDLNPGTSLAT